MGMDEISRRVQIRMLPYLNNEQLNILRDVLDDELRAIGCDTGCRRDASDKPDLVALFVVAKRIEGCSERTLSYYERTIRDVIVSTGLMPDEMTTDVLRRYLTEYRYNRGCGKVTMDNIRRILSSFFSWLEDEDYIIKSPVRRIHKVRSGGSVKETYSDEMLERMRNGCTNPRDLAVVDLLASTGMRIGELVRLRVSDVDLSERECLVVGKGDRERIVYFDARTKIHLADYLDGRKDDSEYLFVSRRTSHGRMSIGGMEAMLKRLGASLGIPNVHPHKFRRTLATDAIDKGMPIEQVQRLLGHRKIDTTLQYAMVNQNNVKLAHRRYIG